MKTKRLKNKIRHMTCLPKSYICMNFDNQQSVFVSGCIGDHGIFKTQQVGVIPKMSNFRQNLSTRNMFVCVFVNRIYNWSINSIAVIPITEININYCSTQLWQKNTVNALVLHTYCSHSSLKKKTMLQLFALLVI